MLTGSRFAFLANPYRRGFLALILIWWGFFTPITFNSLLPEGSCDILLHLFFQAFLRQSIVIDHSLPLWCHHVSGGFPLHSHPEFPFPNFFILLSLPFSDVVGLKLALVVFMFFAALSLYRYLADYRQFSPTPAILFTLAVFVSSWTRIHFFTGGDINDAAVFLFIFYIDFFHAVLTPRGQRSVHYSSLTNFLANTIFSRKGYFYIFAMIFLIGNALSSGKMHMGVFLFCAALYTLAESASALRNRNAAGVVYPFFFALTCLTPFILFRSRIESSMELSFLLTNAPDYGRQAAVGLKMNAVTTWHLFKDGIIPYLFLPHLLLLAVGGIFAVIKRNQIGLLLIGLCFLLMSLLGGTPAGQAILTLPFIRGAASYKYVDFPIFLVCTLLPAAAISHGWQKGRWRYAAYLGALVFLADLGHSYNEILNTMTAQIAPVETKRPFSQVKNEYGYASPYFFYVNNLGILSKWGMIFPQNKVVPRYTFRVNPGGNQPNFSEPYCGFPEDGDLKPNPEFPGDSFFLSGRGEVFSVTYAPNSILIDAQVDEPGSVMSINAAPGNYWTVNIGGLSVRHGLTSVSNLPAGRRVIKLEYKPDSYLHSLYRDLLLMTALLVAMAGLAIAMKRN